MKKFAILTIIGLLLFGFTAAANAQDEGCQFCCKVVITGCTYSCGGFYIPCAGVDLCGPLAEAWCERGFSTYTASDELGMFAFWGKASLGNYYANSLHAYALFTWGGPNYIYYEGVSGNFNVNCAVIGQLVQLNFSIPMWAL